MPTIRILLTLALQRNWSMLQLDVSNTFLHEDLPDTVFMRQPIRERLTNHSISSQSVEISFLDQTTRKYLLIPWNTDCKLASTPITPKSSHCNRSTQPFSDPKLYRKLTGSLQYLSITRPDIDFATNSICQHMHNPTTRGFQALKRLIRYIKGIIHFSLPLFSGDLQLKTYADADWASDSNDHKFISGYCTFLGPNLVSWTIKKQVTVEKSSAEAEYRSLSSATSDVIWLHCLASELQIPQHSPTVIH
ncbi:uncharacterized protein LOC110097612 [Dendrobium catenatum]|uniref:uncharacterized protein LOC110097612 n=1 Tax=Dendrobium catenatum TaxID=906689 RepID=UPI0009F4F861|nr:uncharacterized protein LOC110097612 [Dendrobium catenatum]